jgi:hypothetical protein
MMALLKSLAEKRATVEANGTDHCIMLRMRPMRAIRPVYLCHGCGPGDQTAHRPGDRLRVEGNR